MNSLPPSDTQLTQTLQNLPDFIVKWVDVGIFVVNRKMEITLWNHFMARHSEQDADEVMGKNLFACFPDLPEAWLAKKIQSVFLLKNFAFTSWEQRPYLFRFPHNRPITGGCEFMYQNCTFLPVKNDSGEVESVCITLMDVTDVAFTQTLLKEALETLGESSNRDGLTGIYNRRYLDKHIAIEFDRARRYGEPFSFILFDLDHFKQVNDNYGHLGGDEVLRDIAQRVSRMLRTTDIIGRYGGEEFGIILPSTSLEDSCFLAERVREIIAQTPVPFQDKQIRVSISMGVSEFKPGLPNFEQLIHEADQALYASKEAGRNRVTSHPLK